MNYLLERFLQICVKVVVLSVVLSILAPFILYPSVASASETIFSDSFGSSNTNSVTGWVDSDGDASGASIKNNPDNRSGSPTTGYVKLANQTSSIAQMSISTSGYENIHVIYYWRGSSAESDDELIVEWKKSSDSTYLNLAIHDLNDETWSDPSENIELPIGSENTLIDIRFRLNASANNDIGLIDDVSVIGDIASPDADNDGVTDDDDNCPITANADQADNDEDGIGDVCDTDDDNDTVLDDSDNCQFIANIDQTDVDEDGIGDACDGLIDSDNDTVPDSTDNCPNTPNLDQADADDDGIGDVCDTDADNDGVVDGEDNCVNNANADQLDTDGDGAGDVCDETPNGQATLIVKKIVVNDDEGESSANAFSFQINGGSATTFEEDGQNDVLVEMGTYTITEVAVAGYTTSYENCSEIILSNGGTATCIITNNDDGESQGGGGGGGGGGSTSTGSSSLHTIVGSVSGSGSITPAGSNTVTSGSNQSFSIIPGPGSQIVDVIVDGVSVGPVSGWTFSFVTANHTINAIFTPIAQVAGIFTIAPAIEDFSGGQTSSTSTATEEPLTDESTSEITPIITEENNQIAALGDAPGLGGFLEWLGANWLWILFWLLLLAIAYYLYQEWKKNQKKNN